MAAGSAAPNSSSRAAALASGIIMTTRPSPLHSLQLAAPAGARIQTLIKTRAAALPSSSGMDQRMEPTAANQQAPTGRHAVQLPHGLDAETMPGHVAFILDGWHRRNGVPTPTTACLAGGEKWKEIVKVSAAWGISAFTTCFVCTENWCRPQVEMQILLQSYTALMHNVCEEFIKLNIQARTIGDISRLPTPLQDALQMLEHRTTQNDGLKLSLGMNYGGRNEIVQACRRIVAKARNDQHLQLTDISEELLDEEMFTGWLPAHERSPDFYIRVGGNQRLSNFLLWQSAYTEFLFLDCLMLDMDEIMYAKALLAYSKRKRIFGKY
ncbi:hypothetical protein GOP47_0009477 [Adiantum capillus-veneris]|uniref:Alkyl transferase n=1 Tax=Adiantum capillus-veneris TaxID=13818 RepID=A0A9D4ZJJ5_ADICA|nr:hypothetical protein GOP47_0009477 [Adiantum capillus-veneris]